MSGATELGSGVAHKPEKQALSQIIERLNALFAVSSLSHRFPSRGSVSKGHWGTI